MNKLIIIPILFVLAFSQNTSDLCVIEVGLGGTFDATNINSNHNVT